MLGEDPGLALFESWEANQSLFLEVLSKLIQIKLKPYGQSGDMTFTFLPLIPFKTTTGANSGKFLCQKITLSLSFFFRFVFFK